MRLVQRQQQTARRPAEQWEQPWPVPALETLGADTDAIDAMLDEVSDGDE